MAAHKLLNQILPSCCALALCASSVFAQSTGPQPLPFPAPIATPQDIPYPGVINLEVDATDTERNIFQVRESIPVRGGYMLVYTDTPSDYYAAYGVGREYSDLTYSLGMSIDYEGWITSVLWEGPAFKNGLTRSNQIIAVNGTTYDIELLESAIVDAQQTGAAIELLIKDGVHYRTVPIDYREGLRYPHLERAGDGPAYLDEILAPRK
jgi:predicted metalloprotease with PDZ domain